MTQPRCAVCGSVTRPLHTAGSSFTRCGTCGYALADGAREAEYWTAGEGEPSEYWSTAKNAYFTNALDRVASLTGGPGRLLDIGGGVGFFAELAVRAGWDAVSFDISENATAHAARRVGPDRAWSSLTPEAHGTFDAVTIWCVVAHTLDPHAVLSSARQALKPGGVVWVTTPNFSFQRAYGAARLRVGKPLPFLADDHLGQFTPSALRQLLIRERFTDLEYHYVGVTERCSLTGGERGPLLAAKRAWNRVAVGAMALGLPNLTSELQLTGRAA